MNTQKFEAPSGINLYNNINTWINEISVKCPGMTSTRTQSILGRLEKIKEKMVRLPSFIEERTVANQEQKNIMSNLNGLYKEIKYGKNYRDYVNNRNKERRRQASLSTPAQRPISTPVPGPRSLSTPAPPPPTPVARDTFISPVGCFIVPEGYSLQYNDIIMKIENDEITGKRKIKFEHTIIEN